MFRRERDTRRTAKAVRTHEKTMDALAKASLANDQDYRSSLMNTAVTKKEMKEKGPYHERYGSVVTWAQPESVRSGEYNLHRKIDAQRKKGLITQGEAAQEKLEIQYSKGKVY